MQSTLSEQIQGIMKARLLVIKEATSPNTSEDLRSALNEVSRLINDGALLLLDLNMTLSAYAKVKSTNIGSVDHCAIIANNFFEQLLEISKQ